ncbi:hypothetical protein [Nocardia vinacea]|uniref:hypothetical protein n=1 Tax=Nocardia vinacea TaxID=96468 RepID=UPI0012F6E3B7|nr:hypothetical protein [Nocardia vinacea]
MADAQPFTTRLAASAARLADTAQPFNAIRSADPAAAWPLPRLADPAAAQLGNTSDVPSGAAKPTCRPESATASTSAQLGGPWLSEFSCRAAPSRRMAHSAATPSGDSCDAVRFRCRPARAGAADRCHATWTAQVAT